MSQAILVVDDDPVQRRLLEAAIAKLGHKVIAAESGEEAMARLTAAKPPISAVVLDLIMPEMDGMDVMKAMRDAGIDRPVIVQTAKGGIETVVSAMRLGAFDFVVKPVSPERLHEAIEKALKFDTVQAIPQTIRRKHKPAFTFKDIVSRDPGMERVKQIGAKAAMSQIPVLIEGESGVGKELVARAIQGSGDRADKPFVTVNCGALPENLVESLLFGHEKGAFTGAADKHSGKFVEADGGTLFLDEIGELPLDLQVKLLRAIQEGEIDPVGAKRPVKINVRIISATNRDLLEERKAGRFREDLYYRLNVLPITIPPLRERRDDIPALVFHFVKRFSAEENKSDIVAIRPDAMEALKAFDWPGNIRELENAIFRAVVLCDGEELTLDGFPQIVAQLPGFELDGAPISTPMNEANVAEVPNDRAVLADAPVMTTPENAGISAANAPEMPATGMFGMARLLSGDGQVRTIEELESEAIQFAIEIYNGRMSEIARRLGIGRSTLYRKLKEYGIDGNAEEDDSRKVG